VILEIDYTTGILLITIYFLLELEVLSWFRYFRFQLRNHLENGKALKSDLLRTGMDVKSLKIVIIPKDLDMFQG
jgi:hypothetical protein